MTPESEQFKTAVSSVRKRIAAAKRNGTNKGYIDYNGCIYVCDEFISILEETGKAAQHGDFAYAYSVAVLILINLAKLALSADDSAGGITETRGYVEDVLEKVCSGVEYGSAEAEFIFLQSVKDSRNKAFDKWDEFVYDMLAITARLATAKNVGKLYAFLDGLNAKPSREIPSARYRESDCLVRLAAITAVDGAENADRFINDNLIYDGVRRIAIRNSIGKGDHARAEKLCLDRIRSADTDYYRTREWYDLLFEVYLKTEDKNRQADLAEDLLVNKHDAKYYGILKNLLAEKGLWEAEYPLLRERLGENLPYRLFLDILSEEGETRRLLAVLRVHPSAVFDYGKQTAAEFPKETYSLCLDEIRKQTAEADNRIKYKKVCGLIRKLSGFGGTDEAESVIRELKAKYPRRPALLEELDLLTLKQAKKRK